MRNCWFKNPKGVQGLVCGLQNIDLTNDTMKTLGIHFTCNNKIQAERNYLTTVIKFKMLSMYGLQRELL